MSEVAYGKRNLKAIQQREKIDLFYKVYRKLLRIAMRFDNKQVKTISTYPKVNNKVELLEIINKLAWAFPYKKDLAIEIFVDADLLNTSFASTNNLINQRNYYQKNISHFKLVDKYNSSRDLLLYTKAKALLSTNPFKLYKTEIFDKEYFSTVEGGFLQNAYCQTIDKETKLRLDELSLANFKKMLDKNKNKNKAYCFVTGPSFDRYKEFRYEENSFKVICNSTVKNDEFLEYIGKPDLLVFADPVFHFSPSEYSSLFRDYVLKVFTKYKCFIVIPDKTVPLMLAHYPELNNYIIGMKAKKEKFNFPTVNDFYIRSSANILTLYMLPIASSVSKEINILGADGRDPDEKYFWKHSSLAQFDDLMQTVFETHPSFFRDRDYKDYYRKHCDFLNNLIEYGESKGKKYISLTNSHIPALNKREFGI